MRPISSGSYCANLQSLSTGQVVVKYMEVGMALTSKVNMCIMSIPYKPVMMIIPYTYEAF